MALTPLMILKHIWAKTGTTVAFARRAVAAAGAVAGVERRGARSGAPVDVQHSRRAEREQRLEPALRRFWPPPVRREAGP
jgi:hypothetical protein